MYVRPYEALEKLGNEMMYIDELSGETRTGLVVGKERIGEKAVMVFVASPYDDENDKTEGMIKYRDIIMFDDMPIDVHGWGRDAVLKEYGKYIGVE